MACGGGGGLSTHLQSPPGPPSGHSHYLAIGLKSRKYGSSYGVPMRLIRVSI